MLTEQKYDHYGLTVFKDGNREFAIAFTEEEADMAARKAIEDSLWAFNPDFLAAHCNVQVKSLAKIQQELCEDANDAFRGLIRDFDHFVKDAIAADGRGHFLSPYDSEECELRNIDPDEAQLLLEELREEIETGRGWNCLVYRLN
jgi:hypothetical protein